MTACRKGKKNQYTNTMRIGHSNDFHWAVCNYALFKLQIRSNNKDTRPGGLAGNLNSKQAQKQTADHKNRVNSNDKCAGAQKRVWGRRFPEMGKWAMHFPPKSYR